jgi:predicted dehydrogenase
MKRSILARRQFLKRSIAAALALPAIVPASAISAPGRVLPSDRITIGVIGLGKQGSGLLWSILDNKNAQVLAVCDVDKKKVQEFVKFADQRYAAQKGKGVYKGCDGYSDFRDIISRTDIDAIITATPDHWHAIISTMAAESGKDVYCEKPLSLTIAEAREMVNVVRKYNCIFQTGSMQRSDGNFRHACELVRNGYIGEVKEVQVSIRTGFYNHPADCNLPAEKAPPELDWDMWLGSAPYRPYHSMIAPPITFEGWPSWRNYRDYSGGGMTDWGAHHFDIAQWGLGMDNSGPIEIHPADGKEFAKLTYRYKNGVVLTGDFEDNYILFIGTEGKIQVNREYLKTWPENLIEQKIKPGETHLYRSDDHEKNWLDCIRSRTRPVCDVEVGCRTVTVCHLGNLATQLERPLHWNPETEKFINDSEANHLISRARRAPWRLL